MRHGWTAESMLAAIEEKLGYKLDPNPVEIEDIPADIYRDHIGITSQRQPGLSSVGASVLNGRLSGEQLIKLADLADKYGNGQLRATIGQNILIVNVPNRETAALVVELNTLGLNVDVSPFWRGAIACTGTEFCKLAIAETKAFNKWLVADLEERLPGFDQQIRLHVTGCTNSCGQHWIADIGLEGKKIKKDGQMVDAFFFCVGGSIGNMLVRLARSATVRQRPTFPPPSSVFSTATSKLEPREKISAATSTAPKTPFSGLN